MFTPVRSETAARCRAIARGIRRHENGRRSLDRALSARLLAFFADFGELALIAPAFVAACTVLVFHRRHRDALAWALALAVCVGVTLILKIFVGRFDFNILHRSFQTGSFPSGHAGISLVFYDGLAALLWYGSRSLLLRMLATALVSLQAMIVVSVFLLGWHPVIDIVAGLFLGAACLGAARCSGMPRPATVEGLAGLAIVVAAVIIAFHGERLYDKKLIDGLLDRTRIETSLSRMPAG
jgi:hypothetical protein